MFEIETKELKISEEFKDIKEIINNLKQQPLNKNNLLLSNENKDIYKEIVEDLHDNDFLTNDDYNKIHMKHVVQEKESTKIEMKKDDDFEL